MGECRWTVTPVPPEPVRRPARVAIMLALAHKIQHAIDRGVVSDRAEVARRLGLTRRRITQLLDLTLLPPQAQERILFIQSVDGLERKLQRHLLAYWTRWSTYCRRFADTVMGTCVPFW
jgi:hypothetical protein